MTDVDYVDPFKFHEVVIRGWRIPFLTAEP